MIPDRLQYFFEHVWNDKNVTKSGPGTPYVSPKYLKICKTNMGASSRKNQIWSDESMFCVEGPAPKFSKSWNLKRWKFEIWKFENWKLIIWKWRVGKWKIWNLCFLKSWLWKLRIWRLESWKLTKYNYRVPHCLSNCVKMVTGKWWRST